MKIVINTDYGGFSISAEAVKRMAELEGKKCYFFNNNFEKLTLEECIKKNNWLAFSIPDPNKILNKPKNWNNSTIKEREEYNNSFKSISLTSDIKRDNKYLIQTIEELKEKANGIHSVLKVIEIPDGIDYEIDEYDGKEIIREKHRTWP